MVAATVLFTVMIGAVKVARQDLSPFEVVFWRSVTSLPLIVAFARWEGRLRVVQRGQLLLRASLGFLAMGCFFTAAKGMALADLTVISKLQPILVALVAPWLLGRGEAASRWVWAALGLGLLGAVAIVGPELSFGSAYGLFALLASVFSAGAHLLVRSLTRTEGSFAIVFWFQVFTGAAAATIVVFERGSIPLPESSLWPVLVLVGVSATAGQLLMTAAYARDRAPVVAAASYTSPLWGLLADLAVFGVWPSAWVLAGGALVITAGLTLVCFARPPETKDTASPARQA